LGHGNRSGCPQSRSRPATTYSARPR
jgi:hypothetical protein